MSKIINGYELNDDFELHSIVYCHLGEEILECEVIRLPIYAPYEFDVYILKVVGEERELRMQPNHIYKTKRKCVEKAIQNLDGAIKYNEEEIKELKRKIREDKETINKFLEQL
ncbi:MAG: hypothetical protein J6S85_14280 [Methanobrevibacter sp.]|nr:hypothetical protein [Methanobrevibacter sp.]